MNQDPYESPGVAPDERGDDSTSARRQPLGEFARAVFLAWEKLRIIYVAVLVVVTLTALALFPEGDMARDPSFWGRVLIGAVIANVAFLAAPVVETYVAWLGFRTRVLRLWLMVLGTLFASLLAFVVVSLDAFPAPD